MGRGLECEGEAQTAKSLARAGVVAAKAASVQRVGMRAACFRKGNASGRPQGESPANGARALKTAAERGTIRFIETEKIIRLRRGVSIGFWAWGPKSVKKREKATF